MAKVKVYNQEGNIVGDMELPAGLFAVATVSEFVHQAVRAARANARVAIAHTKLRGEVRGGGKKPWKQKGTGRARHGSIRSPIWIGGGVVGGPRSNRNFSIKLNRKARRKALSMVLSDKAQRDRIVILESLEFPEPKTKLVAAMLKKLPIVKNTLLVLPASSPSVLRAARNLPKMKTVTANSLSLLDVLKYDTLLLPRATVTKLQEVYKA